MRILAKQADWSWPVVYMDGWMDVQTYVHWSSRVEMQLNVTGTLGSDSLLDHWLDV